MTIFKHPNGELDDSGHKHAWQVPVEDIHLGPPDDKYKLDDALMCWCAFCGALGWGRGSTRSCEDDNA